MLIRLMFLFCLISPMGELSAFQGVGPAPIPDFKSPKQKIKWELAFQYMNYWNYKVEETHGLHKSYPGPVIKSQNEFTSLLPQSLVNAPNFETLLKVFGDMENTTRPIEIGFAESEMGQLVQEILQDYLVVYVPNLEKEENSPELAFVDYPEAWEKGPSKNRGSFKAWWDLLPETMKEKPMVILGYGIGADEVKAEMSACFDNSFDCEEFHRKLKLTISLHKVQHSFVGFKKGDFMISFGPRYGISPLKPKITMLDKINLEDEMPMSDSLKLSLLQLAALNIEADKISR